MFCKAINLAITGVMWAVSWVLIYALFFGWTFKLAYNLSYSWNMALAFGLVGFVVGLVGAALGHFKLIFNEGGADIPESQAVAVTCWAITGYCILITEALQWFGASTSVSWFGLVAIAGGIAGLIHFARHCPEHNQLATQV